MSIEPTEGVNPRYLDQVVATAEQRPRAGLLAAPEQAVVAELIGRLKGAVAVATPIAA